MLPTCEGVALSVFCVVTMPSSPIETLIASGGIVGAPSTM
jgi:hypothetical protein